jgi:hypothetical protein
LLAGELDETALFVAAVEPEAAAAGDDDVGVFVDDEL